MPSQAIDGIYADIKADVTDLTQKIPQAARVVDQSMSQIERSAKRAENVVVISSGRMANAQRNLGRQISDIGTQLAGGQSPFLILAQQAPQVADALSDVGGKAAKIAGFFAGPWGAAILAAGSVLGVLAGELLKTGDEATTAKNKVDRLTSSLQALASAQGRATAAQLGDAKVALIQAEAERRLIQGRGHTTRGGRQYSSADQARLDQLNSEIDSATATIPGIEKAVAAQQKLNAITKANEQADKDARDAKRDHNKELREQAKATREAEKAQKELEKTLDGIVGKYDPARKAASDYRETLDEIDLLVSKGKLNDGEAFTYKIKAAAEQADAIAKAAAARLKDILGYEIGGSDDPVKKFTDAQMKADETAREIDADAKIRADEDRFRKQRDEVTSVAAIYENAFRGGTKRIWDDFKDIGLRIIAQVLAEFTIAQLTKGGGGFDLGKSLLSAVGSFGGGRAVGGTVAANRTYMIGENGPELLRMGSSAGTIHPNASVRSMGGGQVVQPIIQVDARGAVMNDQFADMILARADATSKAYATSAFTSSVKAAPSAVNRAKRFGTI